MAAMVIEILRIVSYFVFSPNGQNKRALAYSSWHARIRLDTEAIWGDFEPKDTDGTQGSHCEYCLVQKTDFS
jgi:hypothetical protein